MHKLIFKITGLLLILTSLILIALHFFRQNRRADILSLFPIQNYDQNIFHWIKPTDPDYKQPLLNPSQQKLRYEDWYNRNYGPYSPWNKDYLAQIYSAIASQNLKSIEQEIINFHSTHSKSIRGIGYGSNFRPYTAQWILDLQIKMNLSQFDAMHYDPSRLAIATTNINGRQLPTNEVHFHNSKIAGEGYPFDNLAVSLIWAGTPLYILGETVERDWSLVLTPSFIAWVKNTDIARVDEKFIKSWEENSQQLVAIIKTNIPIIDTEDKIYRFSGYIGMAFPGTKDNQQMRILIPISDEKGMAHIRTASIPPEQATFMPLLPTPQNFANIINQLIGRSYGWGGIYFYNDCALELKNLYTPFGIWLPMRSIDQTNQEQYPIKTVDLSKNNLNDRLAYLTKYGHKLMTIITVEGHVFMLVDNYSDPKNPRHFIPLSYQNVWALHPKIGNSRQVIGQAALLPILPKYPENSNLLSHADEKYFKMGWLDDFPKTSTPPKIDLHSLLDF